MTATRAWISVEGLNGVGKTHLVRQVAAVLGPVCVPLVELPDAPPDLLPGRVIAALRQSGDLFLRTGTPRTETLLLMALQVHRHEHLGDTGVGQVMLEDRGPHTVALYQAAILTPDGDDERALHLAEAILATIGDWRPFPDLTVLLRDDPARCLARFERRIGRSVRTDERMLMERVDRLYGRFIAAHPQRMSPLDRRDSDESGLVAMIVDLCRTFIEPCTGAPWPEDASHA